MGASCAVCCSGAAVARPNDAVPTLIAAPSGGPEAPGGAAQQKAVSRAAEEPKAGAHGAAGGGAAVSSRSRPIESKDVELGLGKASKAREDVLHADDGTKKARRFHDPTTFSQEELSAAFNECDTDQNGVIDIKELSVMLRKLQVKFTSKSVKQLLTFIDEDGSGEIDKQEFLEFFHSAFKGMQRGGADLNDLIRVAMQRTHRRQAVNSYGKTDVYIIHAMLKDAGDRLCWWLANVLESNNLSCSGPYLRAALEPENQERYGFRKREDEDADPFAANEDTRWPELRDCRMLILLVHQESLVGRNEVELIDKAGDLGIPICCFYEASVPYIETLHSFKQQCPLSLAETTARPVTRLFPRDSGDVAVAHVYHELKRAKPDKRAALLDVTCDYDDFSDLAQIRGVRWLTPEFAQVMEPGVPDLPEEAFAPPGKLRPLYVSYTRGAEDAPGLSQAQLAALRARMQTISLEGRTIWLDATSHGGGSSLTKVPNLLNILLLSEVVILDAVDPARPPSAYLDHGMCLLEATAALLTGNMLPCRTLQVEELDMFIGRQVSLNGTDAFLEVFQQNRGSPESIIARFCAVLGQKNFTDDAERAVALKFAAKMVARHPFMNLVLQPQVAITMPTAVAVGKGAKKKRTGIAANFGTRMNNMFVRKTVAPASDA